LESGGRLRVNRGAVASVLIVVGAILVLLSPAVYSYTTTML
jgi:hypothetical protein